MSVNNSKIFTKLVSGTTFTIEGNYGLRNASFVLISGAATYQGNLQVDGFGNDALPMEVGVPITVGVVGNQILDGLLIDALGGVVHLIAKH